MDLIQFFAADEARQGVAKIFQSTATVMPKLPIEKMDGLIHRTGKEVGLGEIKRRAINQAPPAANNSVILPVEERLVIGTSRVSTDHRMGADPRAVEIARRVRNMSRWADNEIIHGDPAADAAHNGIKLIISPRQD